jgi:hypothetical protein
MNAVEPTIVNQGGENGFGGWDFGAMDFGFRISSKAVYFLGNPGLCE